MGAILGAEYLKRMRELYARMGKRGRTRILNEFCEQCGVHRKHAIRVLGALAAPPGRRGGRKVVYGPAEAEALKALWLVMGQPCSRRMGPALKLWLAPWEEENGRLAPAVRRKLLAMSPATMDRLLRPERIAQPGAGRRGIAKAAAALRAGIPIRTHFDDADRPGYIEADGVAHCGGSMAGDFIWSLTFTDIWSGWTEQGAVWNRGAQGVLAVVRRVEAALPFEMIAFDSDNGPEFLNHHLRRHLTERGRAIHVTRSRPYMSNDNAHVEQKQWTHARQLLGYGRLGDPALVEIVNSLLIHWGHLQNLFMPSLKLASKERQGAKVHRTYETARTPCQRLLDSPHVTMKAKAKLKALRKSLNPLELNRQVEAGLALIRDAMRSHESPGGQPPDPRSLSLKGCPIQ